MFLDLYRQRHRRQARRRLPRFPPDPQGHLENSFGVFMSPIPSKLILREVPVEPTWLDLFSIVRLELNTITSLVKQHIWQAHKLSGYYFINQMTPTAGLFLNILYLLASYAQNSLLF